MICVLYFINTSFTCRFDIQYFFFHNEQNQNAKISLRNFENSKKFFARRTALNKFFRHNVVFDNHDQIDSKQFEQKLNFLQNEVTTEFNAKKKKKKNDDAAAKRENFKKTI